MRGAALTADRPAPPTGARGHGPTIALACLGAMAAQMALTVTAPLTGLYQTQAGASATDLTWIIALSFAPTAVFELNFGVLGDLFGRKRLIVGGAVTSAAGAVVGALAASPGMLYVSMALLGLGAAALLPTTLATAAQLTPEPGQRIKVLARWALSISFGAAFSPLIAGVIGQEYGMHVAFIPLTVILVATAAASALWLEDTRQPEGRTLDLRGQALSGIGLIALIYAVIQGAAQSWSSPGVIAAFVIAALALPAFVIAELRHPSPMFQIRLLAIPAFRAAAVTGFLGMLSFLGVAYSLSIKLGPLAGEGPLAVALPFVIIQIVPLILSRWLPGLLHRYSPRVLLIIGLLVMAGGEAWFASLPDGETRLVTMIGPIGLMGVGFIVMFSSLTAAAINSVPHDKIGMASGATSLVRESGQTLGSAVLGAVAVTYTGHLLAPTLNTLALPKPLAAAAHAVYAQGGAMALVKAPLPAPLHRAVAPAAFRALSQGYDAGMYVMVGCAVLAALTVALLMRGPAGSPAPEGAGTAAPAKAG